MRKLIVVVIITFCATLAHAQVFPLEERLEVLHLYDGTVLRGVIRQDIPDRYVELEIHGGSTFAIDYDSIRHREQIDNPDYSTLWIKVDVGDSIHALLAPDLEELVEKEEVEEEEEVVEERERGPFLGTGHVIGVRLGFADTVWSGRGHDDYFDNILDVNDDGSLAIDIGASYTYMQQARPDVAPALMWGTRVSFGLTSKRVTGRGNNPADPTSGDRGTVKYSARVLEIPLELLVGGGGDRFIGYGGAGVGLAITMGDPRLTFEGEKVDFPYDVETPAVPFLRVSGGGLIKLTPEWSSHVDLFFHNLMSGWYSATEFSQMYTSVGLSFGLGYHIK
jgi:hypothetical protein